jgi:hypothetical protein
MLVEDLNIWLPPSTARRRCWEPMPDTKSVVPPGLKAALFGLWPEKRDGVEAALRGVVDPRAAGDSSREASSLACRGAHFFASPCSLGTSRVAIELLCSVYTRNQFLNTTCCVTSYCWCNSETSPNSNTSDAQKMDGEGGANGEVLTPVDSSAGSTA